MAELKLKVSLDTSYLKGQISRLPLEFAGANVSIRPKFDREAIVKEFAALNRYVNNKKFNIVINTNLEAEIKAADRLVVALGRVQQAASGAKGRSPLGTKQLSLTEGQKGFTAAQIKTLFGAAIQGGLLDEKTLGKKRDQMVAALGGIGRDAMEGLLNGLKSGDAKLKGAAELIGKTLIASTKTILGIASPSRVFKGIGENVGKGFELGAVASMDRAFDALERKIKERLSKLQTMLQRDPSRRGAFPFIASGGRLESAPIAREIDQAYAQLARIQERRQGRLSSERGALAQSSSRLLPAGVSAMPVANAQEVVLKNFLGSMRNADRTLRQNFAANSYLPKATKALSGSMEQAAVEIKALTGTRGPIAALPSSEMLERRKFQSAAEKAAQIDAANAAREQARKASEQAALRGMFKGVPAISAPTIGAENAPLSRAASYMLNKTNRILGLPVGPSSPIGSMGQFPMSGMAGRGSMGQFPMDGPLAVGGASAMGQKIAGPYPFSNTARSARGGYFPGISSSLFFPMSGMMGPSSPLGRITPQSSMFAGGGGGGGMPPSGGGGGGGGGAFGGMQFNMPQLPGAGLVREIGEEFGFAAKQVLLFGTAYKALAFLQSFPGQVGDAVGALQSFRNTIKEISPSAQEAANSSQFILDIVDKYNTPLQSARDGFVKLYASMQPAGFSGDEIRDLFLGISQTAATFGMSADKVDRVNYAFAQMASKGQVMSEELKGQLGDVLPGAMAIFAEAAGFKGPEAITKFSKALEDGAYKGGAMKVLLTNVGSIMRKEFGPGAEGAARTFQGVMNRMQNSLKLLYESFEPVAVGFLNSVVMPMTSGIATITDGFKAFFAGQAAQTAGGSVFAKQLELLRPAFEGIAANIKQILPLLQSFANTALSLGQVLLQVAGNPFVGYLARIYLSVLPLTMALRVLNLQVLIPLIGSFLRAIPAFISFNAAMISGTSANKGLQLAMQLTGQTAGVTAGKIRLVGAALATLGTTAILAGIGLLIERFLMMKSAIDGVRQSTQQMLGSISGMANSGAVKELQNVSKNIQKQKDTFSELKEFVSGGRIAGGSKALTPEIAAKFQEVGMGSFVSKNLFGKPIITDFLRATEIIDARLQGLNKESSSVAEKLPLAVKVAADIARQAKTAETLATIPPGTGDGTDAQRAADKARRDAERLANQQQQAAIDAANRQNALDKSRFEGLAALSEQDYQHRINLIDLAHEYELNGLNSIEARQAKFQQELQKIELKRIETVRKAQEQMQKAQIDYAAAQRTASAAGTAAPQKSGLPSGVSGYITGDPKSPYYKADHGGSNYHEHLSFVSRKAAEEAYNKLRSAGITVTEFMGYGKVGRHTPGSKHYEGLAFDVPGAQVPVGKEPALTARVQSILGFSGTGTAATMQRRSEKAGGAAGVEQQDLLYKGMESGLSIINATTVALKERENLIAANINTIFPVAEQKLENDLMKMRNQLQLQGMPQEYIDFQEQQYKTTYETAEAIKSKRKETLEYTKTVEVLQAKQAQGQTLTKEEAESLRFYTGAIEQNDQALTLLTERQKAYNIAALEGAIASIKNADALKAQQDAISLIDGNVESATGSYKNFIKEVAQGGDAKEALKKFQESITDQVLTVFLDYSFKPVEEFFKNSLKNMFGLPDAEKAKQDQLAKMEAQLAEQKRITIATEKTAANTTPGAGANAGTTAGAFPIAEPGGIVASMVEAAMNGAALPFDAAGLSEASNTIGTWGDSLNTQLSESLTTATATTQKEGSTFSESLGKTVGAIGIAAGSIMGIAAGIGQIKEGGTSNVLGGIGSVLMSLGGAVGGFAGFLKGANGGIAGGGWKPFPVTAFANGGMVNGPTLGLVGEGKYNEAIVPLPDGRSIPVQMKGGGGLREAMSGNNGRAGGSPILNMSFQSTNINGVEYVSRDQLEQAMAVTRRQAASDGAKRGMSMTLDKLQQSPSTRSRLGMGGR